MPEYIYDYAQGDDRWFAARLGSIGGSSITHVLAKGQGKTRKGLMYKLAAEILSCQKTESYTNKYMDRGTAFEPEARACYEFITGSDVVECALVRSAPRIHVSPDGLVGEDGGVEIKVLLNHVFVEYVDTKKVPVAYYRQCQHFLFVTGRQWVDFVVYSPEMPNPMFIQRQLRDETLIRTIKTETNIFLVEVDELVERMQSI